MCTWVLAAPKKHRVKLSLLLLRVNDSRACVDNHVEIIEGKNIGSQMIGRYCNPKLMLSLIRPIYSVGRYLTIILTIKSSETFDFVAEYTSASLSEGTFVLKVYSQFCAYKKIIAKADAMMHSLRFSLSTFSKFLTS
jgi:hypothetical protein